MFLPLLLTFLGGAPALATTVVMLPPTEQAADSTAIVDAVVGSSTQSVDEARGRIYTDTVLHVSSRLAGSAPSTVSIRQLKGTRPDGGIVGVVGDANLVEGERVVAFVRHHADGRWYLTALGQSVWHVAPKGEDPTVRRDMDAHHMLMRDIDGTLKPADQSFETFGTLSELVYGLENLACGGAR